MLRVPCGCGEDWPWHVLCEEASRMEKQLAAAFGAKDWALAREWASRIRSHRDEGARAT